MPHRPMHAIVYIEFCTYVLDLVEIHYLYACNNALLQCEDIIIDFRTHKIMF